MPRSPRLFVAGGIYHVTARGNNGDDIFRDDLDRSLYLQLLATANRVTAARILAYVLMANHIHLAVQTTAPNLYETIHRTHRPCERLERVGVRKPAESHRRARRISNCEGEPP